MRVAAILALALAGCTHTQTLTRSCLTPEQYAKFEQAEPAKVHGKLTGNADADIRPIAGSAYELRAWGHALLGALRICA